MPSEALNQKVKVGTQLTKATLRRAKMVAAQESKPLSEVFEEAIGMYVTSRLDPSPGEPGLERFLSSPPTNLSWDETRRIMDLDYFDQ